MHYRRIALLCGITGLLAGLALSGCNKSSSTSDEDISDAKKRSVQNLREIGLAMHNHASAYSDRFPSPGLKSGMKQTIFGPVPPYTWRFELLPFIEQASLYNQGTMTKGPLPDSVRTTPIKTYLNPRSKDTNASTNYRVFVGNGAAFEWGRRMWVADFPDGFANTILVVEAADPIDWASLDDFEYDPKSPLPKLGIFPGGFHALMADGDVRWIPSDTDEKTIRYLITRNDGQIVNMPGKSVR